MHPPPPKIPDMRRTTWDRKPNRQAGHDYSTPGAYFVTICVDGMIPCFGKILGGVMHLNEWGTIAERQWRWVFGHFEGVAMDEFVVMPDHVHGIVHVLPGPNGSTPVGTTLGLSLHPGTHVEPALLCGRKRRQNVLSKTVNAFKTTSSKLIHTTGNTEFRWQRSFHDRIIRDNQGLQYTRCYIIDNPRNWRPEPSIPICPTPEQPLDGIVSTSDGWRQLK